MTNFKIGDVCVVTRAIMSLEEGDIVEVMDVKTPYGSIMMQGEQPIACVSISEANLFIERVGEL
jgi:hypothetical protein